MCMVKMWEMDLEAGGHTEASVELQERGDGDWEKRAGLGAGETCADLRHTMYTSRS